MRVECVTCGHAHIVKICTQCNCGSPFNCLPAPRSADADRIAQLTAELAEANAQLADVEFAAYRGALDDARTERDTAVAEAAAMIAIIERMTRRISPRYLDGKARHCPGCNIVDASRIVEDVDFPHRPDCLWLAIRAAKVGDAGRALAERVRLWRELEATMRIDGNVGLIDDVLAKLSALDAKGGDS